MAKTSRTISSKHLRLLLVASCLSAPFFANSVMAQEPSKKDEKQEPVDLQADSLVHDQGGQSVTASGNVVLIQAGRTVKADKIVYNLKKDSVVATGNVEYTDINGDKHYGDNVQFNNALKDGFVEGLKTFLVDGSRFKASNGRHEGGTVTIMKDAYYTPCETCKDDPDAAPLWQIRASEVKHDKESKTISYRNARFEVKGVPVGYVPYFEHPDGTVERKSGFLTPSAGYKSSLGAFIQSSYYWDIAPEKDLTVGLMAMTNEVPLLSAQWRQRWESASLTVDGSFTYSKRTDNRAGVEVDEDREFRGNIAVDGKWDINEKWRAGAVLGYASDDQYLRQYDFDSPNVLRSEIYAERFSGRDYLAGRLLAFQDLRIDDEDEDQPHVLPEISFEFLGEPASVPVIGGRWKVSGGALGVVRDDDEQDVNRLHGELGWERRLVSDFGLVSVVNASAQAAWYNVNDRTGSQNDNTIDGNSSESRAFGYVSALTSYPLERQFENSQMVIEPLVSVTVAPNISVDSDIPNEDSQDVQLDALNLFEADRFPGVDGVEDQSHVTYGVKTGLYGHDGSYGNVFVGQSYRFDEDDNPFEQGSGLDDQDSDVVGQISGSYQGKYTVDYRFQLDNHNLSSQRHEVDASVNVNRFTLSTRYLYARELDGTDIDETREQIRNSAAYYINDKWRIFGAAQHDLGQDSGLREAHVGLDYLGQCVSWSLIGQKNLTDDASGDSGTEIFFRLGLKNLGEFGISD